MGDPANLSLFSARERVGPELDARLVALARNAAPRVSTRVLREVLATASRRGTTALFLDAIRRLLALPLFERASEAEQLELVELLQLSMTYPPLTEKLLELWARPQLAALGAATRSRLGSYAVGPRPGRLSPEAHGQTLASFWLRRAQEVDDLLATRPRDAEVRDYLVEPARPLHLLRTRADLDLLIIVFGRLSDPAALSYNRTYFDDGGRAEAAVLSPCPLVASGWRSEDPIAQRPFEARSTTLTRLEEHDLIRWVEENHIVSSGPTRQRGQVPVGMLVNARRFGEAIEPVANLVASARGPLRFRRSRFHCGAPAKSPVERRKRPAPSSREKTNVKPPREAAVSRGGRNG